MWFERLRSGNIHRALAMKHEQRSLAELAQLAMQEELEHLRGSAAELGLALQHQADFRKAFSSGDAASLGKLLDEQFHQYFVTAEVLPLQQIQVRGRDGRLLAVGGMQVPPADCANRMRDIHALIGAERMKVAGGYCTGGIHYAVRVPIGGLRLQGYLLLVTDPVPVLGRVRARLGYPVRIRANDGQVLRAEHWPEGGTMSRYVVARCPVRADDGRPLLALEVAHDARGFLADLERADVQLLVIGLAVTALLTLVAGMVLRHTMVQPLDRLIRALQQSNAMDMERALPRLMVRELATLKQLYDSMHQDSCTDPLTGLANRKRFESCLECLHNFGRRHDDPFALLVIDLDGFKGVNDTYGHDAGDQLLQ